jgi:hypothetical protein
VYFTNPNVEYILHFGLISYPQVFFLNKDLLTISLNWHLVANTFARDLYVNYRGGSVKLKNSGKVKNKKQP